MPSKNKLREVLSEDSWDKDVQKQIRKIGKKVDRFIKAIDKAHKDASKSKLKFD